MLLSKLSEFVFRLSLIKGIGPAIISKLTRNYKVSEDEVLKFDEFSINDFIEFGFSEKTASILSQGLKSRMDFESEYKMIQKEKSFIMTPFDLNYPYLLKTIQSVPPVLYFKGNIEAFCDKKKILTCIGSRKSNLIGERALSRFICEISEFDPCIVSGGAIGGDSMAHQAALKNRLKTIVVFGSGLCNPYPSCNLRLFDRVLEDGGVILSQFKMDISPSRSTFPERNMILAGISDATFVVQAGSKSGTIITAQAAIDFGRSVGVLPGNFDDELFEGCHDLLKQGASLITRKEDLIDLLNIKYDSTKSKNLDLKKEEKFENKIENEILEFCKFSRTFEEILNFSKKNKIDLQAELFSYELNGDLEQDHLGRWSLKRF
jgi:DNA processing protein